jgi:antitoxin component of MazEF toxin-antitoxin module
MLETRIARYGNSLSVRLPAALARDMDLREGDRVTLRRAGDSLVIERSLYARLQARLATVREREREVGAGRSVGAENAE